MNSNLIFCSYAYLDTFVSTVEKTVIRDEAEKKIEMYLKCCVVSLLSAKQMNPDCDIALITNILVPEPYRSQFASNEIQIIYKDYDSFRFDKEMKWSLAFYKLCALKYAIEHLNYQRYLIVDSDTYFISAIDDLWVEADHNIMLFDMSHSLSVQQSKTMNNEYLTLYNENELLTNYGGEFLCGNLVLIQEFINECYSVYLDMQNKDFKTVHGDEFIICIVAHRMKQKVKNASAYIYRYWTGKFYLASTNYIYNPINILHMPSEKETGLKRIYNYVIKKGILPKNNMIFKWLGLPSPKRPFSLTSLFNIVVKIKNRLYS